jgi:anthranilate phosphoribosyltransferase
MIQTALADLLEGRDLSREQAREVMDEIMRGEATQAQIGGFLIALRLKGETADEIAGCAEAMRDHVLPVRPERDDLVDTAGTGGDGASTINISTALRSSLRPRARASRSTATAQCRRRRARPTCSRRLDFSSSSRRSGLRSRSTSSASASCSRGAPPGDAPRAPVRRELATRTVFNVLGPLTNPAGARAQVIGVYSPSLVRTLAEVSHSSARGARSSSTALTASTSSRRPGPNDVCEVVDERCASGRSTRSISGSSAATRPSCVAARRPRTRRRSAESSRRADGGAATRSS